MNNHIFRYQNFKLGRQFSLNVCRFQKQNHYDCLGVSPKATQGDIKTAYYKLSKQYHPDVNRNNVDAAVKFRDITAAYEVLGNLKTRKLYDRGLMVGTYEEIYTSDESNNYQHVSFHKHRNKPTSQRTVKTAQYDIDEWTRAHYSETFTKEFVFKESRGKNIKQEEESLQKHGASWPVFTAFIALFICGIAFGETTSNFDKVDKFSVTGKQGTD